MLSRSDGKLHQASRVTGDLKAPNIFSRACRHPIRCLLIPSPGDPFLPSFLRVSIVSVTSSPGLSILQYAVRTFLDVSNIPCRISPSLAHQSFPLCLVSPVCFHRLPLALIPPRGFTLVNNCPATRASLVTLLSKTTTTTTSTADRNVPNQHQHSSVPGSSLFPHGQRWCQSIWSALGYSRFACHLLAPVVLSVPLPPVI